MIEMSYDDNHYRIRHFNFITHMSNSINKINNNVAFNGKEEFDRSDELYISIIVVDAEE